MIALGIGTSAFIIGWIVGYVMGRAHGRHVIEKSYADRLEKELLESKKEIERLEGLRDDNDYLKGELQYATAIIEKCDAEIQLLLYYVEGDATFEALKQKLDPTLAELKKWRDGKE